MATKAVKAIKVPQNVLDSVYGSKSEDWHQHSNGKGWVYKTAHVDESAYLHPTSIGCHVHDITEWLTRHKAIGRTEGYTGEQISEYGEHISYLAKIAERLRAKQERNA